MLSKLIEKRDRLLLGKCSTANTLVESAQLSNNKGNTGDMITVAKVALLARGNSVANILEVSVGCVSNTANSAGGATTAVDTQAPDKEVVAALLMNRRALRCITLLIDCRTLGCIALGRVDNDVDGQLAVGNIVARVSRDASAKLAAMIDDLLEKRLGLRKREGAVSNALIKGADSWVVADIVNVNAGDMLSVAKPLARIYGPDLSNELT